MNIPAQANYIAQDASGQWYWYAAKPWHDQIQWRPNGAPWGDIDWPVSSQSWEQSLIDIHAEAACSLG